MLHPFVLRVKFVFSEDLESAQKRAYDLFIQIIRFTQACLDCSKQANLPQLTLRQKIFRLTLFYKIYHHNPKIENKLYPPPTSFFFFFFFRD